MTLTEILRSFLDTPLTDTQRAGKPMKSEMITIIQYNPLQNHMQRNRKNAYINFDEEQDTVSTSILK